MRGEQLDCREGSGVERAAPGMSLIGLEMFAARTAGLVTMLISGLEDRECLCMAETRSPDADDVLRRYWADRSCALPGTMSVLPGRAFEATLATKEEMLSIFSRANEIGEGEAGLIGGSPTWPK